MLNTTGGKTSKLVRYFATISFFIVMFIMQSACAGHVRETNISERIDLMVQPIIEKEWATGIVVGLIEDGKTSVMSFGSISRDTDILPDRTTLFEIGSITKTFTAFLLLSMAKDHTVNLTDPVNLYLPAGARIPRTGYRQITLQDLAAHVSGLPRLPANMVLNGLDNPYENYREKELYEYLSEFRPTRPPGKKVEYSNTGAGLLGHLLALKAGVSYETILKKRILELLGMNHTGITLSGVEKEHLAQGYTAEGEPESLWDFGVLKGCGGIRSSVEDLLKYLEAQMGLVPSPLSGIIRKSHEKLYTMEEGIDIGYAWMIKSENGMTWHDGSTGGYSSFIGFNGDRKSGVVVLTNTPVISAVPVADLVGGRILKLLRGGTLAPMNLRKAIKVDAEITRKLLGVYRVSKNVFIRIAMINGHLAAKSTGEEEFYRIYSESNLEYFYRVSDAQIRFIKNSSGRITRLILHATGVDTKAEKIE